MPTVKRYARKNPTGPSRTDPAAPKTMIVIHGFANDTELKRRVEPGEEIVVSWGLAAKLRKLGFARNK